MVYIREELENYDYEYLMNMLREEYPFKSRFWYECYETKEEVIDKLLKSNEK